MDNSLPSRGYTLTIAKEITLGGAVKIEYALSDKVSVRLKNGSILLEGSGFNIERLDLAAGNVCLSGTVSKIVFGRAPQAGKLKRLFK